MLFRNPLLCSRYIVVLIAAMAALCPDLRAQGPSPDAPTPTIEPAAPVVTSSSFAATAEHRFWDKRNVALFAASAALSGADFTVTRANLQNGGRELNPIVRIFGRSTAGLAANFVGETAGGIGLSYFFHKTGHHKLERMVSFVNIGASAGAVGYGLAHR
ncbi:MAG TPA: hypothetical protein VMR80_04190 [Candidatus Acidoferrum sp.]|jgi:hypothetical protein|nr:hypothetical protein [Candidatus Acidoferrum sp.]